VVVVVVVVVVNFVRVTIADPNDAQIIAVPLYLLAGS
jgi:hypothetical protein